MVESQKARKAAWWRTDRLDVTGWVALLLWLVAVVLVHNDFQEDFSWWDGRGVFALGAGVILLVETGFRLNMPTFRSKWWWTLLWAVALLALGLGLILDLAWLQLP